MIEEALVEPGDQALEEYVAEYHDLHYKTFQKQGTLNEEIVKEGIRHASIYRSFPLFIDLFNYL